MKNKGITLVALVITIIVLIILAGVSINAIMNDGLIDNSKEARDKWEDGKSGEEDSIGYLESLVKYSNVKITGVDTALTNPENAMPEGAVVIEGDASKGIVIKDTKNNEWVWIEVPKNIYSNATYNGGTAPTSKDDYTAIETVLQAYVGGYRGASSYSDKWSAWDEENGIVVKEETEGLTDAQKALTNVTGLTYDEYISNRQRMLTSVYENGGFWVGRYEAGTKEPIMKDPQKLLNIVVQQNMYPYYYATVEQAQQMSEEIKTGNKTTSLMFGIQWDLIMKFIENKGYITAEDGTITDGKITYEMLATSTGSDAFGNYSTPTFTINRGKYLFAHVSGEKWINYDIDTEGFVENKVKVYSNNLSGVLFTTGAVDRNKVLNMYDIAGNYSEMTLERFLNNRPNYYSPVVARGGLYMIAGQPNQRTNIANEATNGFRPAMW